MGIVDNILKWLKQVKRSIALWNVESQIELVKINSIVDKCVEEPVYNFKTSIGTYCLAEGVVVHNCDTISMLGVLVPWKPSSNAGADSLKDTDGIWAIEEQEEDNNLSSYIV